MNSRHKNLWT